MCEYILGFVLMNNVVYGMRVILGGLKGTPHRPSLGFLRPCRISLLLYTISRFCIVKTTTQPLSHICPIDKREAFVIPGRTYVWMPGESCNANLPWKVGFRTVLFGKCALGPWETGVIFLNIWHVRVS